MNFYLSKKMKGRRKQPYAVAMVEFGCSSLQFIHRIEPLSYWMHMRITENSALGTEKGYFRHLNVEMAEPFRYRMLVHGRGRTGFGMDKWCIDKQVCISGSSRRVLKSELVHNVFYMCYEYRKCPLLNYYEASTRYSRNLSNEVRPKLGLFAPTDKVNIFYQHSNYNGRIVCSNIAILGRALPPYPGDRQIPLC
jgi:hypothetical protein